MSTVDSSKQETVESRKKECHEILESRKRKLTELYFVHQLDKIRPVTDDDVLMKINERLDSFLEENNLENGHRFNWEHFIEEFPTKEESEDEVEEIIQDQPEKVPKESLSIDLEQMEPEPIEVETIEEATEKPIEVESTGKENSKSLHKLGPSETDSIEIKPLRPTLPEIESIEKSTELTEVENKDQQTITPTALTTIQSDLKLEPPRKKRKSPDSHISLYNPNNKDAIDTTVLILKEFLPAKVAESTPLAELYYLAQTLPLVKLIPSTHKVVTSNMFESALTEGKINVVHSRIEELKRQGKWSLRQPTRFIDPIKSNQRSYWDNLLSEMNWMALDFKEARKLKIATCAYIAESISEYWKFGKVCCIKRKEIKYIEDKLEEIEETKSGSEIEKLGGDGEIFDCEEKPDAEEVIEEKPEVEDIEIEEVDSIDISKLLERPNPMDEIIPPDLPETSIEEYNKYKSEVTPFKLLIDTNELNPNDKTLLDNIPSLGSFQLFDDYFATAPLVPVSKVVLPVEDESYYNIYLKNIIDESDVTPEQQKGLFGFSAQKRISTSIKPPSPPNLKYLDLRTPTIWLPEDDQDLIEYVNQFSFNWGVVSAHLSKRPTRSYSSNIERRTPWQCFERYIQLNDTFQINDMRGSNTLHAMKWLEHAHNIQATTKRRISPLGVGVESIQRGHKRLRWASMFEAVRKCMRKRESVTRPNNNQVRKQPDDKKIPAPTPAELSKLKYERDKAIQDAYLQNSNGFRGRSNPNIAGSRPISGTTGQQQSTTNTTAARPGQPANNNSAPSSATSTGAPGLVRTSSSSSQTNLQAQTAGVKPNTSVPLSNNVQRSSSMVSGSNQQLVNNQRFVPNQQSQKLVGPNGQPYTPEQLQQIAQLRQRKLQQQNGQSNNSGINSASSSPNLSNAQLNGTTSRSNSNPIIPVSSPNLSQAQVSSPVSQTGGNNGRKLAFVPAHVSAVINQIQSKNPNLSKAEVTKMAAQYLANLQAKQNRVNSGNSSPVSASTSLNPQNAVNQQRLQQDLRSKDNASPQLQTTRSLTPQQKAQLDMLKALHAEQQQKRQESTKGTSSTNSSKNNSSGGN